MKFTNTGTHTIVLVDDERDTLTQISRILIRAGYNVIAFSCPFKAMGAMLPLKNPLEFDLLLTDLDLNAEYGWTGAKMVGELRAHGLDQPMIVWSGGRGIEDVPTSIDEVNVTMSKSDALQLVPTIRNLLGQPE